MHEYNIAESVAREARKKARNRAVTGIELRVGELSGVTAQEMKRAVTELSGWETEARAQKAFCACSCGFRGAPKILAREHDFVAWACSRCGKKFPKPLRGKDIVIKKIFLGRAKRRVFVLGSEFYESDALAFQVAEELARSLKEIEFVKTSDAGTVLKEKNPVVLDAVKGIRRVRLVSPEEIRVCESVSAHDLDYGFLLRLARASGKSPKPRIIGIPLGYPKKKAIAEAKKLLLSLSK